ncbi:MAG: hypothetical protein ACRDKL_01040 [Solirubrobacteraceae bacterium]
MAAVAVRRTLLAAALALAAGAALSACGSTPVDPTITTTPVTFTVTTPVPTTTVPTPTSSSYIGPQAVPIQAGAFLAPAATTALGTTIDGIQCNPLIQLAYTAYVHLQVYVHGRSRALPGAVGMVDPTAKVTDNGLLFTAGACYYWLHTRAADGVIMVQSPVDRRYTLGDLFALWRQPLSRDRVAHARGPVTALVNGRPWTRGPRQIPLREHTQIQLAVGTPVPRVAPIDWAPTGF